MSGITRIISIALFTAALLMAVPAAQAGHDYDRGFRGGYAAPHAWQWRDRGGFPRYAAPHDRGWHFGRSRHWDHRFDRWGTWYLQPRHGFYYRDRFGRLHFQRR